MFNIPATVKFNGTLTLASGDRPPIDGATIWLKASSLALADGDPVATWPDLSGNSNHAMQITAGARPTLQTASVGKVVRFDGLDDFLSLVDLSALTAATAIIVVKSSTDGGVNGNGLWQISSAPDNQAYPYAAQVYENFGRTTRKNGITVPSVQSWRVYAVTSAADGTWNAFMDGASVVADAAAFGIAAPCFLGKATTGGGGSFFFPGDVAELFIFPTALNTGDRQAVETYLGALYGITIAH